MPDSSGKKPNRGLCLRAFHHKNMIDIIGPHLFLANDYHFHYFQNRCYRELVNSADERAIEKSMAVFTSPDEPKRSQAKRA